MQEVAAKAASRVPPAEPGAATLSERLMGAPTERLTERPTERGAASSARAGSKVAGGNSEKGGGAAVALDGVKATVDGVKPSADGSDPYGSNISTPASQPEQPPAMGPAAAAAAFIRQMRTGPQPEFTPRETKRCMKLATEMRQLLVRLQELWKEPDYATGHAFVVFRLERTRNEFIKRVRAMSSPRPTLLHRFFYGANGRAARRAARKSSSTRTGPAAVGASDANLLPRAAADKARVQVMPAPEPSDVLWENLEVTDEVEVRVLRRGFLTIVLLLCFSIMAIVTTRALKARNEQAAFAAASTPEMAAAISLLFSALASLTTAGMNAVLKQVVIALTSVEGQDSHTEFEVCTARILCPSLTLTPEGQDRVRDSHRQSSRAP